jgi:micrococcal nuclease
LAFVWVDGVLLNLELVQQAYTGVSLSSRSKYFEIFTDVENEVMKTGRRYWGELDPDYRY